MSLDLLYFLGRGSRWQDNELRYSLRSAEAHLRDLGRVIVVGEKPAWLVNVDHLRVADDPRLPKAANTTWKLKCSIDRGLLGARFALMNDDFFFLRDVDVIEPAHKGPIAKSLRAHPTKAGVYYTGLRRMQELLQGHGYPDPLDYGLHQPMVIQTLPAAIVLADMMSIFGRSGFLFRTAYGNLTNLRGSEAPDCKVFRRWSGPPAGDYLSTDPRVVMSPDFRRWIRSRLPKPSRYEAD